MFGGLAFLIAGRMSCGGGGDELMVRTGPEFHARALAEPHAREMAFTGRSLGGFVYVGTAGVGADADLERRVTRGVDYTAALPPK